ncbi:uncharacterized protein BXIN_2788 [Babesia sp. Xinjiang]|uniref:uncharacterized protein n=1 Tax=Babesia sp. Xinjiang TaxID=462227 RepID=UPI000A226204|nr:uncharacterized protein BXIN_2788 [Babesia sp. Xinjiang]ORM41738.1 hypothetical protein BXIN_2788 [Babesia sp. Xinjiang]
MDFKYYLGDLNHDTFDKWRRPLAVATITIFVASALHIHAANLVNSVLDASFGLFIMIHVINPTWLGLLGVMTLSLTLLATTILLLIVGVAYEKIVWSAEFLKNTGVLAYGLDIIYYLGIFVALNFVWERPAREGLNVYEEHDNANYNDQDDVWTPFSGTGKAITEYDVRYPKVEASVNNGYAV